MHVNTSIYCIAYEEFAKENMIYYLYSCFGTNWWMDLTYSRSVSCLTSTMTKMLVFFETVHH